MTVTQRVPIPFSVKRTVAVSVNKGLWGLAVTSVKRTTSTTGPGQAAKSVLPVTDW